MEYSTKTEEERLNGLSDSDFCLLCYTLLRGQTQVPSQGAIGPYRPKIAEYSERLRRSKYCTEYSVQTCMEEYAARQGSRSRR